jgi:hypothetical protein
MDDAPSAERRFIVRFVTFNHWFVILVTIQGGASSYLLRTIRDAMEDDMLSIILNAARSLAQLIGSAVNLTPPVQRPAPVRRASPAEIAAWSVEREERRASRRRQVSGDSLPF